MDIREYSVKGMTCQHCVDAVRNQVSALEGVQVASVNLGLGLLTVGGAGFSDEAVRDAVAEAGYEVTG